MKKNPWLMLFVLLFVFGSLFTFVLGSSAISLFGKSEVRVSSNHTVLKLSLDGVILDGKKFLRNLIKYREDKHVKAILIEVESPGGVVGPSQEIYKEIKRTREEFKIPVVVVSTGLNASGAYYASVAADKIVVAPGTMIGSIGVIMEFINLEKLYDWAKISRYSITTGRYKDSGAEYRAMREDEKSLFQDMINEVWTQFKTAVQEGRNLKPEVVEANADGRVMTGAKAVELGFADEIGTVEEASRLAARLAKIDEDDFDLFEPPKRRPSPLERLFGSEDEDDYVKNDNLGLTKLAGQLLRTELANRPLYLMPGYWQK